MADILYNAEWMYNHIVRQIRSFEANLDETSEVAVRLASFGSSMTMKVSKIGFENPHLLYFCGTVEEDEAELIQHMGQLNFLLVAEDKDDEEAPPRRLGFECLLTEEYTAKKPPAKHEQGQQAEPGAAPETQTGAP